MRPARWTTPGTCACPAASPTTWGSTGWGRGELKLVGLVLGRYTIQETIAPAGYAKDTHTYTVNLTLTHPDNSAFGHPDGVPTFVNSRLFRLIVLTCNESLEQLEVSAVTLSGQVPATKDTIGGVPAHLAAKGVTEQDSATWAARATATSTPGRTARASSSRSRRTARTAVPRGAGQTGPLSSALGGAPWFRAARSDGMRFMVTTRAGETAGGRGNGIGSLRCRIYVLSELDSGERLIPRARPERALPCWLGFWIGSG